MIPGAVLKASGLGIAALIAVGITGRAMYGCGSRSRDEQVTDLASRLAQSEHTVELKDGLYVTKLVEIRDLGSLLDRERAETKAMADQLDRSKSELLTTQQIAVKWKSAYEGILNARQTDSGPSPTIPGVTRRRVDFQRDFGPISVSGHTLTDPPEGEVSVRQTRPLLMTVGIARDRNGKWTSLVTSSEPTMEVGVTLAGVDLGSIPGPSWYQRIWFDVGASALGDLAVTLGSSYRGDRYSLGLSCFESSASHGCGLTVGIRPFR